MPNPRLARSVAVLVLGLAAALPPATTPAQTAAPMVTGTDCTMIPAAGQDQWREAGAADYDTPWWHAWREATGSDTPWQATGDFDGDGREDLAHVMIGPRGHWMVGIDYGHGTPVPCRGERLLASFVADPDSVLPIRGLLALPVGQNDATCGHLGGQTLIRCTVAEDTAARQRRTDALLVVDDNPSRTEVWVWDPEFHGGHMAGEDIVFETAGEQALTPRVRTIADSVPASVRQAAMTRLRAANQKHGSERFRSRNTLQADGFPENVSFDDFQPPDRLRSWKEAMDAPGTSITIGSRGWFRTATDWRQAPDDRSMMLPAPTPAEYFATGAMISVTEDRTAAGPVTIITLREAGLTPAEDATERYVLDAADRLVELEVRRAGMVSTTTWDYAADFPPIEPPLP